MLKGKAAAELPISWTEKDIQKLAALLLNVQVNTKLITPLMIQFAAD